MFDYSGLLSTANKLIADFGKPAVIKRPGVDDVSNYPAVVKGATTDHACTVVQTKFKYSELASGLVETGDVKFIVAVEGLTIEPNTKDRLEIDGQNYNIKMVDPLKPGQTIMLYQVYAYGA